MSTTADRDGHPLLRGRLRGRAGQPAPLERRLARHLAHLAELRDRDLLTDTEYERARRRLLGH